MTTKKITNEQYKRIFSKRIDLPEEPDCADFINMIVILEKNQRKLKTINNIINKYVDIKEENIMGFSAKKSSDKFYIGTDRVPPALQVSIRKLATYLALVNKPWLPTKREQSMINSLEQNVYLEESAEEQDSDNGIEM